MFVVPDPERFAGSVVGTGHCVAFVQRHANMPHTSEWRRGRKARGGDLPRGTVVATFGGDPPRYQNRTDGSSHAAVFVEQHAHTLVVWDQWRGQPVHRRNIRFRNGHGKAVNDGDRYFVVVSE